MEEEEEEEGGSEERSGGGERGRGLFKGGVFLIDLPFIHIHLLSLSLSLCIARPVFCSLAWRSAPASDVAVQRFRENIAVGQPIELTLLSL